MASIDDTVRASGRSIASAQTGRADGAPLFYLHGLPGSRLDFHDPFNQAALDGVVEDYRIWARPSGLDYRNVGVPVRVWHGDVDRVVPMHHAEYVCATIPNADLVVLPGVGHLHTAERWHQFITEILGRSR
jgi:pimeloyl-ACP methyl ester carboxylesterase